MRQYLLAATLAAGALVGASAPASAALLTLGPNATTEGLTYTLETQTTANPLTNLFALKVTGINVVGTDTRLHRTGLDGVAFNDFNQGNPISGTVLAVQQNNVVTLGANGFVFQDGGLNAGGCNGSGAFYCFNNGAIPPIPSSPANDFTDSTYIIVFSATLGSGTWAGYTTDLKIAWVSSAINNYSNVSLPIPVNTTCPDCSPTPFVADAAEPASLALLGMGLLGTLGFARRYRG